MKNYNYLIKKNLKKNYKNSTILDKDFLNKFWKQRKEVLKKIQVKKKKTDLVKNDDSTFKKIEELYLSKNLKKNEKYILIFHKKFEVNLELKIKYNNKFLKLSNLSTSIPTYCYLGLAISRSKTLNELQKINTILKIIDKITLNQKYFLSCKTAILKKLILIEENLLKKVIYE